MIDSKQPSNMLRVLIAAAVVNAGLVLFVTYKVFEPILKAKPDDYYLTEKLELPDCDANLWRGLAVQEEGRTKPFESAAIEALRQITGRSKFEKLKAVDIVLSWMMLNGTNGDTKYTDWEQYPFILCDYQPLRRIIFTDFMNAGPELEEKVLGKYITPMNIRLSRSFAKLLDESSVLRTNDPDKAIHYQTPEQRKAEEVAGRLNLFDSISQNKPESLAGRLTGHRDPLHLVGLDRVSGGAWFSIGELRAIQQEKLERLTAMSAKIAPMTPAIFDVAYQATLRIIHANRLLNSRWDLMMEDRLAKMPQLYISPERQKSLKEFQEKVKAGTAQDSIAAELAEPLKERSAKEAERHIRRIFVAIQQQRMERVGEVMKEICRSDADRERLFKQLHNAKESASPLAGMQREIEKILFERYQEEIVDDLKRRIQVAKKESYHPEDDRFRMLHLGYLENRFPNVYKESAAWQEFPEADASLVTASFDEVKSAYRSGDAARFAQASQHFFSTVEKVSGKFDAYPGVTTIPLELEFNRVQPFMWAWIIMLGAFVLFLASLLLDARWAYVLGFGGYAVSLGLQLFGFYARVAISGRPPVSNMYETVIFVPFMVAVFALILEVIYRKKYIALAGSLVATLGLVLADQLPMVLDPKISPLVPVLRSNYWLIVHVLTIVASYAGGALAWGLGNLAMTMIAFGKSDPSTVKTLSKFTYSGIKIAVLLLGAGTFLGGWWAAESWGRFWGWDPKEVWALIALVCYVIPLHARYVGWLKDFGLAVAAVICFAAIMMSWYGVNFVLGAGLHSYGVGTGGPIWILWAGLLNIEWVLIAGIRYVQSKSVVSPEPSEPEA